MKNNIYYDGFLPRKTVSRNTTPNMFCHKPHRDFCI